jgi:protein-S-isoprenylcysteine O-methyltransferase Ste14
MHIVDVVIPVIWVLFWVYWIAASIGTKATQTRSASYVGVRVVIIIGIAIVIRTSVSGHRATSIDNPWLEGIGLAVFLSGLGEALWARRYLGRNWGTPMSQKVDPELVTSGPYRYVRHPIYSGIIVGMIGTALAISPYWFVAVLLLGGYFIYSSVVEEHNMERTFPDTYPAYKRSTHMLVPFIF